MRYVTFAALLLAFGSVAGAKNPSKPTSAAERMIQKFDRNGDGALDASELAAAIAEHQEHHAAKTGKTVKATKGPASDIAKAEMLIKRFDTNGDGKLNAAELQNMLGANQARHEAHKKVTLGA